MLKPVIIQGGMGVSVSNWRLARAVCQKGQLGVVSSTGMDTVLARQLQNGDPGGHRRRSLKTFPFQEWVQRLMDRFFIPGGKDHDAPFKSIELLRANMSEEREAMMAMANYSEVMLAKEGHDRPVGINLLEKIQIPTLPSIYGAMLAGVDYVLMGAGIPRDIPRVLDQFAQHLATQIKLNVAGAKQGEEFPLSFNPAKWAKGLPPLKRPHFLAIISSSTLGKALLKNATGRIDGFVVEGHEAGGHNSPPRNKQVNASGEPDYGPRDTSDMESLRQLGVPFWMAGSYGHPDKLKAALEGGACGVQVGTAFAWCRESGLMMRLKKRMRDLVLHHPPEVFTDPRCSATGFPFKVVNMEGTLSDPAVFETRKRLCDTGYLCQPYRLEDGAVGYRCPAEPIDVFVSKGGEVAETEGRKCLCNGLFAAMGLAQRRRDGNEEMPVVTSGKDLSMLAKLFQLKGYYRAADVIDFMLEGVTQAA